MHRLCFVFLAASRAPLYVFKRFLPTMSWLTLARRANGTYGTVLAVALALLAGCTAAPVPALNPALPSQWRNAASESSTAQQADLQHWWRAFDDAELDALVARALENNLDVAQAVERLHAARLLNPHAHDSYLPSLRASTNNVVSPDTSESYFVVGFDAVWELPLFGAWQSASRIAQGNLDAANANLHGAYVSLVAEVARRWIELRSAQQQERLLEAVRDADSEKLRLLGVRVKLRLASPTELATATAALAQADAALAEPRQAIQASAQQLAVLLGQDEPDPAWLQPGAQPQLGDWQLSTAPADLLRTRPEIAAAEAEVLHAAGELGISRADIYPHIGIGTSLEWSVNIASTHNHVRTGEGIFSLGPMLDIPLFDWGQRVAKAHAKDHELKAAVYAYRQAVLQGVAEAETAMASLQQLHAREDASLRAAQALQQGDDAMRKRVDLKLSSQLELQESQLESHRAELELVSARAARDLAYVSLYKALGGAPLPPVQPADDRFSRSGER